MKVNAIKSLPAAAKFVRVEISNITGAVLGIMFESARRNYLVRNDGQILSRVKC